MKILAAVVRETGGPFEVEELELSGPRSDEVLVRIAACGVCHADMIARDQELPVPLPVVAGHEGAGVVEAVGEGVPGIGEGDHVILSFSACWRCEPCRSGRPAYCLESFPRNFGGSRPDGSMALSSSRGPVHGHYFGQSSFATHAVVPSANVVVVAGDAPLELYAPLGCGVQTGAGAVINSLRVPPGSGLAVFGAGSVGLSAVMAARAIGVTRIIAVDVVPERLALATTLGATDIIDAGVTADLAATIREITGGAGIPYSLDTSGRPETIRNAADALTVTGTLGLIAPGPAGNEVTFGLLDLILGRTVRGIQQGDSVPSVFIPRLIDMHRAGLLPLERIITHFPFAQINEAAEATHGGGVVKPVLMMDGA